MRTKLLMAAAIAIAHRRRRAGARQDQDRRARHARRRAHHARRGCAARHGNRHEAGRRQGRRQDDRGDHVPDQCEPGLGDPRRPQAGRAGQGRHPDRPGVGLGRHRDPRLFQDAAAGDVHQRLVRRAGDDLRDAVAELLPLQHGRLAVARRPRQLRLQRQEVAQDRDRRGRLFVPLHAAVRLRPGILRGRRPDRREVLGAARHQGLRLDHRQAARRRRRDLSRPRRRRRGQLLQSVRPGRRQGEADRRLDPGRPDRAVLEGRRQAHRDRHSRPPARRPTCGTMRSGRPG